MTAEPAGTPHLRVVADPEIEQLRALLMDERIRRQDLERDIARWRRRYAGLESEIRSKRHSDPLFETADTIFRYWREKCRPRARTFSDDRQKAVLARLKDRDPDDQSKAAYSPRFICEAILGARVDPYVDPKGKRHDDLELICRTGRKLEDFRDRYLRSLQNGAVSVDTDP